MLPRQLRSIIAQVKLINSLNLIEKNHGKLFKVKPWVKVNSLKHYFLV